MFLEYHERFHFKYNCQQGFSVYQLLFDFIFLSLFKVSIQSSVAAENDAEADLFTQIFDSSLACHAQVASVQLNVTVSRLQ